jgi:branched-chain amino acid transport system substrate-binding protein
MMTEGKTMNRRMTAMAAVAIAVLAASASGCGKSGGGGGADDTLIIGIDLPLQGASKDTSESTVNAMKLYLDQVGKKAGKYKVDLKVYDDSTAAKGAWDDAKCKSNAQEHVATAKEVAVMGTYNSGCAKLEVPDLNQDPKGPLLMVSHANTNPGLTKTWDPGEPAKYYPTGKRNYARVVTTDDYQGPAAAQYMIKDLQVKRCFVLNDNQTYGQGVAKTFVAESKKQGITITGEQAWDAKQTDYAALFNQIKGTNSDCVYLGGIFDNNGGQLIKDKVKVLGDNNTVKLMGPDGFTGYPELTKLAEAQGMYLTFAGLATEPLRAAGGAGAKFLDSYKAKFGADPIGSYPLYGVQALQVILAAIEKSDGTRKSVNSQVFDGAGITIPASTAVLGKEIKIDPKSGDVNALDISVEIVKDNKETYLKAWPVS